MSIKVQQLLRKFEENKEIGIKALLTATKRSEYSEMEITVIYAQIMTYYSLSNNSSRVINLFENYKKLNIENEYANSIDIFGAAGIAYAKTDNNKQSAKCFENYLKLLDEYKKGGLKTSDITLRTPQFIGDFELAVLTILVVVYSKLGNEEDTLKIYFRKKKFEKPDWDGTMLTIGMIVKNEEKTLEDCLKALSSLREKVKCELIIVDTGSVDKTVEIAAKYADEVRHFAWINDFSAARNESLRGAKGDWFMYLDADEIFESTKEIEHFFTSAQHIQFNFGSYIVRNYVTDTAYSDFSAPRLARIMECTKFHRSIHESIWMVPPTVYFKDFVHHKGYLGNNSHKKNLRNISNMLRDHKENPDDITLIYQIAQGFLLVDENAADEYLELGLKKAIEVKEDTLEAVFRAEKCYGLNRNNSLEEAYKFAKESTEIYDKSDKIYCVCADIYAVYTISAIKLNKDFDEIKKAFERFLKIYDLYNEGKIASVDLMVRPSVYTNYQSSQIVFSMFCNTCIENEKYDEAKKVAKLREKPSKDLADMNYPYIEHWLTIMRELEDYSELPELTKNIITSDVDDDLRTFFYQLLLKAIMLVKEPEKNRGNLIGIIYESVNEQEKVRFPEDFVLLISAFDSFYNRGGMTEKEVTELFSKIEKFTSLSSDIIPLLMVFEKNLNIISDKLDFDFIKNSPEYILAYSDKLSEIIINYTSKFVLEKLNPRVQLLLINICIYLLCSLDEETEFDTDKITNITSTLTACYLESAYTAEVISEEHSEHLSLPVRIGFYLFLAKISLADGNIRANVMYLRKLLSFEPRLKEFISRELKNVMQSSIQK